MTDKLLVTKNSMEHCRGIMGGIEDKVYGKIKELGIIMFLIESNPATMMESKAITQIMNNANNAIKSGKTVNDDLGKLKSKLWMALRKFQQADTSLRREFNMRTDVKVKTKASVKKDKISEVKKELTSIKDNIFNCADSMWKLYKRKNPIGAAVEETSYDFIKDTAEGLWSIGSETYEIEKELIEDPEKGGKRLNNDVVSLGTDIETIGKVLGNKRSREVLEAEIMKDVDKNLIHGDAYTRTKFLYGGALNFIPFGAIGKVGKLGKAGEIVSKLDKLTEVEKTASKLNKTDEALKLMSSEEKIEEDIEKSSEIAKLRADDVLKDGGKAENVLNKSNEHIKINDRGEIEGGSNPKTVLDYIPSSSVELKAIPGKTTTVLGTYVKDTGNIINELGNIKSTDLGARTGGFNLLNTPDELYKTPEQFWDEYNKPWLNNVIERNDEIILATKPTDRNLYRINKITGSKELTGFGKEYNYLLDHDYVLDTNSMRMILKK
ncbi:MAG: hypothetical protein PHX70_06175 [Clostridium sp.]|nr:hypothetical protein [Clostridium sp.]